MGPPSMYPLEIRERAVRLVRESERWGLAPVARDLGVSAETLRTWVRQAEANDGSRQDLTTLQPRGASSPWL